MLDALVSLFCRSNISAEILWDGGWLLRQLFPYSEAEFNSHHLKLLKVSYIWKRNEKAHSISVIDSLKEMHHDHCLYL